MIMIMLGSFVGTMLVLLTGWLPLLRMMHNKIDRLEKRLSTLEHMLSAVICENNLKLTLTINSDKLQEALAE